MITRMIALAAFNAARIIRRFIRVMAARVRFGIRLFLACSYDGRRFFTWSVGPRLDESQCQLRAMIQMQCHNLEKGLSIPEPRLGFGVAAINVLLNHIPRYVQRYGRDELIDIALAVLSAYVRFHDEHGGAEERMVQRLCELQDECGPACADSSLGGATILSRHEILAGASVDLERFFHTRHSIRQFSEEPVDDAAIRDAVALAQSTPSACNRQPVRVYSVVSATRRQDLLALQKGTRGFGHAIGRVLVVASDLGHFAGEGERNQCWVDGGMFAMSLIYALHSKGLGTCCLAWQPEPHKDRTVRRMLSMRDSEVVVVLIAVGNLPNQIKVAVSQRKPLSEIFAES